MEFWRVICIATWCGFLCINPSWAQPSGTLRYIENEMPQSFDPVTAGGEAIGVRLSTLVFSGLYTYDLQRDPTPDMAVALPSSSDIVDGSTVQIQLRPGLMWQDGRAITAEDVKYSVNIYKDPRSNYPNIAQFENIERIDVHGNQAGFVLHNVPTDPTRLGTKLGAQLRFYLLPRHAVGQPYLTKENPYCRLPTASGPFMYVRSDQAHVELKANPHYHHPGKPLLTGVTMVVDEQDNLHGALVRSGAVDLDPVVRAIDVGTLVNASNVEVRPYAPQSWSGLAFRSTNEFLKFKVVRQALTHAFNRAEALEAHYTGQGELISGPFPVSSPYYNFNIDPKDYNLDKARSLLAQAGFVDADGDGTLDYNGKPVRLNMVLSKTMPSADKEVCQDFQTQLSQIGVSVEIRWLGNNLYTEAVRRNHNFDITYVTWKFDEASNIYPLFSREHQAPGMFNFIEFYDGIVEDYLQKFRTESDEQSRRAIGQQLHSILNEECPYLFLWTLNANLAYTTRLRSMTGLIEVHPLYFFTYINDWYLEK